MVGNAFYSENRKCIAPDEYLQGRHRNAHLAAAAAGSRTA
jgi:hypothetical protein